jgi:hypothetical protein
MSWLYSRALVEASLAATCSDGARSALSSGSPTPRAYLPPDRMTAFSRLSRFGMTFGPLTDDLGAELLTWFLAASRAKTSASPARAQASTESAPACGPTWRGSLAKFDPASCSWKTAQPSLLEDWAECSVTWPRSGMTAAGLCWELPTLEHPTAANDSGLWVPTPIATEWKGGCGKTGNRAPEKAAKAGLKLGEFAKLWPTPTVCGNYNRKGASATSGDGLATAVYQTPVARMWNNNGKNPSELERNSPTLAMQAGGALSPTWVEWLMGWPLGWTDLKLSATDRCQPAPQQHGECLQDSDMKDEVTA